MEPFYCHLQLEQFKPHALAQMEKIICRLFKFHPLPELNISNGLSTYSQKNLNCDLKQLVKLKTSFCLPLLAGKNLNLQV